MFVFEHSSLTFGETLTIKNGVIHTEKGLARQFPAKIFDDNFTVEFALPGSMVYNPVSFGRSYRMFYFYQDRELVEMTVKSVDPKGDEENQQIEPVAAPESWSGDPVEPAIESDHDFESIDVKEVLETKENLGMRTGSILGLFNDLASTASGSGSGVSLSSKSVKLLFEKMEQVNDLNNNVNSKMDTLQKENEKLQGNVESLQSEIENLRQENKELQGQQTSAIDGLKSQNEQLNDQISKMATEFEKMKAEMSQTNARKTKKIKRSVDMTSSILSQFSTSEPKETNPSLVSKIEFGAKQEIEHMEEEKMTVSVALPQKRVNDDYVQRLKARVFRGTGGREVEKLEEDIIHDFIQQLDQSEVTIFDATSSKQILAGKNSFRYPPQDLKQIIALPINDNEKRWGLLILTSLNPWVTPPFIVDSFFLDSKNYREPPGTTSKMSEEEIQSHAEAIQFAEAYHASQEALVPEEIEQTLQNQEPVPHLRWSARLRNLNN